jgi:hypothetical protein
MKKEFRSYRSSGVAECGATLFGHFYSWENLDLDGIVRGMTPELLNS